MYHHIDYGAAIAPVTIRRSRPADGIALARLAALDSRTLPAGDFLLAEIGGEVVAAAPLDVDVPALGDPFRRTAELRDLLERWRRPRRRRLRLA